MQMDLKWFRFDKMLSNHNPSYDQDVSLEFPWHGCDQRGSERSRKTALTVGVKEENLCWFQLSCVTVSCYSMSSGGQVRCVGDINPLPSLSWTHTHTHILRHFLLPSVNIKQLWRVVKMGLEQQFSDPVGTGPLLQEILKQTVNKTAIKTVKLNINKNTDIRYYRVLSGEVSNYFF